MRAKDGFTGMEGRDWLNAEWPDRCSYDNEGNLLTPGCSVEPLCRNYTTFGETFCMRDHYYELWDLEKNFGEKTLCEDNLRHPGKNPNIPLEEMIFGEYRARGPEKESERKFDVGVGKESTPYGVVLNDCCVLKISGGKITKNIPDPCSQKKIRVNGKIQNGGRCVRSDEISSIFGSSWSTLPYMFNWWTNYKFRI